MYSAGSGSRAKLPLKPYKAPVVEPSIGYITFSQNGIRIRDILSGTGARMITQPNDIAVKGVKYAKLKLYLTWPGYSSAAMFVMVDCYNVSRANLLVAVSRQVAAFIEVSYELPLQSFSLDSLFFPDRNAAPYQYPAPVCNGASDMALSQ